jgi:hypothetical protein
MAGVAQRSPPRLPSRRDADRFYLAAEIVSSSDRTYVESKRPVYMQHEVCRCILTVQRDRFDVRVDLRLASGWSEQDLTSPDDPLVLAEFGLRCSLYDLYRGTALESRDAPKG